MALSSTDNDAFNKIPIDALFDVEKEAVPHRSSMAFTRIEIIFSKIFNEWEIDQYTADKTNEIVLTSNLNSAFGSTDIISVQNNPDHPVGKKRKTAIEHADQTTVTSDQSTLSSIGELSIAPSEVDGNKAIASYIPRAQEQRDHNNCARNVLSPAEKRIKNNASSASSKKRLIENDDVEKRNIIDMRLLLTKAIEFNKDILNLKSVLPTELDYIGYNQFDQFSPGASTRGKANKRKLTNEEKHEMNKLTKEEKKEKNKLTKEEQEVKKKEKNRLANRKLREKRKQERKERKILYDILFKAASELKERNFYLLELPTV